MHQCIKCFIKSRYILFSKIAIFSLFCWIVFFYSTVHDQPLLSINVKQNCFFRCQKRKYPAPVFETVEERGEGVEKIFVIECHVGSANDQFRHRGTLSLHIFWHVMPSFIGATHSVSNLVTLPFYLKPLCYCFVFVYPHYQRPPPLFLSMMGGQSRVLQILRPFF